MNEVKRAIKDTKKALIKLNDSTNTEKYYDLNINYKSPIYQALKVTPISELEYII